MQALLEVFLAYSNMKVDTKGRIQMPKELYRAAGSDSYFFYSPTLELLGIIPQQEFQRIWADSILRLGEPTMTSKMREYSRVLASRSFAGISFQSKQRAVIPEILREMAGIKKGDNLDWILADGKYYFINQSQPQPLKKLLLAK